ncbi:Ecto-NOX disulfide-thiol exchanger [Trichinella spiralis]|uniref:Ecto-NOX disulfide-thiol exchanger n=1 Tax=Trichinella spiralis TaxID=6334 RepID=A0ABR3KN94_TRISP
MKASPEEPKIGERKETEKTEVNNTVFVQGIPDMASAQMIAEYFSESGEIMVWLKFPSLWRPSQFLDKYIIEAAEKLSISRKEFVRDLPIEWPKSKVLESFQCFGKLEMSWFSGIVERPSNERAYLLFEKEEDIHLVNLDRWSLNHGS